MNIVSSGKRRETLIVFIVVFLSDDTIKKNKSRAARMQGNFQDAALNCTKEASVRIVNRTNRSEYLPTR
jgi:hypothetical protein